MFIKNILFKIKNIPIACNPPCKSCGSGSDDCATCYENYFIHKMRCLTSCPTKFYGSEGACLPCPEECVDCVNSQECKGGCVSGFLEQGKTCVRSCGAGYAENRKTNKCDSNAIIKNNFHTIDCPNQCLSCKYNQTILQCDVCYTNTYLFENDCYTACPSGYFANSKEMACEACDTACKSCFDKGSNNCIECNKKKGYRFAGGSSCAMIQCQISQYFNSTTEKCESIIENIY